jgi:hypothetical protein
MNTKMMSHNRCIAINKNDKKCRAKLKENQLFCCISHYPINEDLITDGCFICNERINNPNEILYFTCKHAFHRPCYNEWLQYSTYDTKICLLCRKDIVTNKKAEPKFTKLNKIHSIYPLMEISKELNKVIYPNNHTNNNTIKLNQDIFIKNLKL